MNNLFFNQSMNTILNNLSTNKISAVNQIQESIQSTLQQLKARAAQNNTGNSPIQGSKRKHDSLLPSSENPAQMMSNVNEEPTTEIHKRHKAEHLALQSIQNAQIQRSRQQIYQNLANLNTLGLNLQSLNALRSLEADQTAQSVIQRANCEAGNISSSAQNQPKKEKDVEKNESSEKENVSEEKLHESTQKCVLDNVQAKEMNTSDERLKSLSTKEIEVILKLAGGDFGSSAPKKEELSQKLTHEEENLFINLSNQGKLAISPKGEGADADLLREENQKKEKIRGKRRNAAEECRQMDLKLARAGPKGRKKLWTAEEDKKLEFYVSEGYTNAEIHREFNGSRGYVAIGLRAARVRKRIRTSGGIIKKPGKELKKRESSEMSEEENIETQRSERSTSKVAKEFLAEVAKQDEKSEKARMNNLVSSPTTVNEEQTRTVVQNLATLQALRLQLAAQNSW
eukprot:maker-scaffold_2-augustus-gene-2.1-mRNA-1 protein AED:0.07 eAED:0.07 QI:156/1/1/1/1/1/2/226/455